MMPSFMFWNLSILLLTLIPTAQGFVSIFGHPKLQVPNDKICQCCCAHLTNLHQQPPFQVDAEESSLPCPSSYPTNLLKSIQSLPNNLPIDAQRIFHGRGGLYLNSGDHDVTLDWFPPVWLVTSFQRQLSNETLLEIGNALEEKWEQQWNDNNQPPLTWVYQCRLESSTKTMTTLMTGTVPDPHIVTENSCQYFVKLLDNKHTGLFLDMANGRKWVQEHAKYKKVLNLFSYTCSFSIAALIGGADEVVNIDKVRGPLKVGQRNHQLLPPEINTANTPTIRFLAHDIFKSWGKLKRLGPYDLIIADPPTFQRDSFVAKKDYGKVVRRIPSLLDDNGYALLCLNAPELDTNFLKDVVQEEAPELEFVQRLDNPAVFHDKDPERGLKVLVFKKT